MRFTFFMQFVLVLSVLSSCSNNATLVSYQDEKIDDLNKEIVVLSTENKRLKEQIVDLNNQVNDLAEELRHIETNFVNAEGSNSYNSFNRSSSISSVSSQLSNVSSKYNNNSKFSNFKRGGLEKPFNIPASKCDAIIATAKSFLGTPHSSGGLSKSGIDCSGLVYTAFNSHCSKDLPRVAQEMARCGTIISSINNLRKGDLVFFTGTYNTSKFITHVGIYLGNNNFIHTSTSKGVSINSIKGSSYWESKFVYGTRILL